MKIGRNNELIDSISDLGGGNTDRGALISGRSYDTTGDSIFEDGIINSHNMLRRRNDIIDLNNRDDLPLELLGDTGLQDFDVSITTKPEYYHNFNSYKKNCESGAANNL